MWVFTLKQVVLVLRELGSQVSTWLEIMESRSHINLTCSRADSVRKLENSVNMDGGPPGLEDPRSCGFNLCSFTSWLVRTIDQSWQWDCFAFWISCVGSWVQQLHRTDSSDDLKEKIGMEKDGSWKWPHLSSNLRLYFSFSCRIRLPQSENVGNFVQIF